MRRLVTALVLTAPLLVGSSGCGTLLFRDRHGTQSGRVDPNVIAMDAFWLLFWIAPGLVAFGVDLVTGAIYLPDHVERGEGPFLSD